jgi:putative inorganic carbon (HCO3(-)) transporter
MKLLAAAAYGMMGTVLILTKSRGGYLAGAIGFTTILLYTRRTKLALGLVVALMGVGVWLSQDAVPRGDAIVGRIADPGTWEFRQEVWRIAIWMIGDFPFTGIGMGTFNQVATRLYPFPPTDNPGAHNLYLQVGVDLGVIGLVAFLALLALALALANAAVRISGSNGNDPLHILTIGAFASLAGYCAHGLIESGVWGTRAAIVPWLVIGLAVSLYSLVRTYDQGIERSLHL